jgi:uncharacterized protein involved in outer membrane biogenesis
MKWLIRILVALLVILAALMWLFFAQMSSVVKVGIEAAGTEALKVPVKLEKVSLSPWSGRASLESLEIGNPEGFTTPHAVRIRQIDLVLDLDRSEEKLLVIKELILDGLEVNSESSASGTNLARIIENIRQSPTATAAAPNAQPDVKFLVEQVFIRGIRVTASSYSAVTVPDQQLSGLGAESGGITPAQLTAAILAKLAEKPTPPSPEAPKLEAGNP